MSPAFLKRTGTLFVFSIEICIRCANIVIVSAPGVPVRRAIVEDVKRLPPKVYDAYATTQVIVQRTHAMLN